jgi:impB/mucB/samB family
MQPLCLRAFPRAIIHIDADAFFASCEQAVNPRLKGKPVVTGKERGIASAVSYEAKALGIKRGMTIREIKAICPTVIHLPSDYETYKARQNILYTSAEINRLYSESEKNCSLAGKGATIGHRVAATSVPAICRRLWSKFDHAGHNWS